MTQIKKVHLTAICGMGMGTLAGLLKSAGYEVTGSDENVYPPMSTRLAELGIQIMSGYSADNLAHRPDLVIVGNTCKENNPEVQAAFSLGLKVMSFPQALAEYFIEDRTSLVVTGTHGKTTTTSLTAWLLAHAGRNPSFFIGGLAKNFGSSFQQGSGREIVIEGDEYYTACFNRVPKFTHYRPTMGVINSLEFDHGDIYPTLSHIQAAFRTFVKLIPRHGFLAVCSDYPAAREVMVEAQCNLQTYGLQEGAMWRAVDLDPSEAGTEFTVLHGRENVGRFFVPLSGRYNVQNCLAAMLLAMQVGVSLAEIREGLATFEGVRRRQDVRGVVDNVIVLDDFAHHPTKVRETVKGLKARFPTRRLWAVFEPRTQSSRRDFFQKDYVTSFLDADRTIIADVFHPEQIESEHLFSPGQLVNDLVAAGKTADFVPTADDIVTLMRNDLLSGDVVLVMSNGAFDSIHDKVLAMLQDRLQNPAAAAHAVQPVPLDHERPIILGLPHSNGASRLAPAAAAEIRKAV